MTYEERRTIVRDPGAHAPHSDDMVEEHRVRVARPSGATIASRVVVAVFAVIQVVIGLRIGLLLLDAREGDALVAAVLNLSQIFVAPFEGVLRTDALAAGGSVLDVAAVVALVGWTLIELLILALLRIGRSSDEI